MGAAIAAANASFDDDLVRVGPGDFALGADVGLGSAGSTDVLRGAGRAQTRLLGALTVRRGSTASDLTIAMAAGQLAGATLETNGILDGVDVDGTAATTDDAVGVLPASVGAFSHGSITMASGTGVDGDEGGRATIEDAVIDAPIGVTSSYYGSTVADQTKIIANVGVESRDGAISLDAVTIQLRGADATGIKIGQGYITPFPVSVNHVTIVGDGSGTGVAALAGCGADTRSDVRLDHVAIGDVATSLKRVGSCDQPQFFVAADLSGRHLAYDPDSVVSSGGGTLDVSDPVTEDLGLRDAAGGDLRPKATSALIDAGDPGEAIGADVDGQPRPYGGAPDIGAYELQEPRATPTPTEPPAAAPVQGPAITPAPSPEPTPAPAPVVRTTPKRVVVRWLKVGRRQFDVRATVVLRKGQTGDCEGAEARFVTKPRGRLTTTFDADCHADVSVRAKPGTRLRVRFGGTDTLEPRRSRTVRLRR